MNTISIDEVKETYEAQARAAICEKTVAEYADLMSEGIIFPPVIVFADGIEYTGKPSSDFIGLCKRSMEYMSCTEPIITY